MPRGRSARSPLSDMSDVDLDGLAEGELSKLQRQCRIIEGDRQTYNMESQDLIRRQMSEIFKLEKEKEDLMQSVRLSERKSMRMRDQECAENLRAMLELREALESDISQERRRLDELDVQVKQMERKMEAERRKSGGSSGTRTHVTRTHKYTHVLENRLDTALSKFNVQLTQNARLREDIESLRVEREHFENIYRKLLKELQDTHREMDIVMDTSTAAYDSRDEARTKVALLREKADKDGAQYATEMKELQRLLDHERRLRDFMGVKGQERVSLETGALYRKDEVEKRQRELVQESVESYEAAFQQIHAITHEDDLDTLVGAFIEVEDRNFALFNYVNEQNNEIEYLQDQIAEIVRAMQEFEQQEASLEQARQVQLRDLETRQSKAAVLTDSHAAQNALATRALQRLKDGVELLFTNLQCDRSEIEELLSGAGGIQDSTVMHYLGNIEHKANHLLTVQSYLSLKDDDKPFESPDGALVLLGRSPLETVPGLAVQLPSPGGEQDSGSESSVLEEEQRPLTQAELREKIIRGVLRREERAGGGRPQLEQDGPHDTRAPMSERREHH
ncbi:outer dynein arm-docking complex subunit 1-like isoform X1 [Lethenteron reissneri]|uniref:outer dynein arm-docking complex subunit 1-like isoform X1 n=1 Tax=Lethenteron reissneri TaxID=7753 RepID=UPI002AB73883|nr:outer dynein arm-docking complex subunit 1-like isoform X1 [Lethenteron reissneri]XP_061423879.1 outer dynein arm-docking complex subunit 1-like isoform X1 [Lethenteron reissneri]